VIRLEWKGKYASQ